MKIRKKDTQSISLDESTSLDIDESSDSCFDRIARILVCLSTGVSSVTAIAKYCNLKPPTVYRLLNSLAKPRFTLYDSINHRYYLGPLIPQIASNPAANHQHLIMCSLSEMQHLSDLNGETITLSTLIGTQFIPLKIIESRHLLLAHEAAEDIKDGKPILPFGATQKVLLSQLDDKNLKPLLKIAKDTHRRSFDSEAFARELAQIGEQGFAFSSGERIPGALCLSCPVHNYPYPLALSIIAPETRIGAKISRFSKIIKQSANRISRNILESNK